MGFPTVKKFASIPALAGLVLVLSLTSSSAQIVPGGIVGPIVLPPVIIVPVPVAAPSFTYGFSGVEGQEGCAGDTNSSTVDCVLASRGNAPDGAEAFSFGVTADGGTITDITTEGSDAAQLLQGGFQIAELTDSSRSGWQAWLDVVCIQAPCPPILVKPAGAICGMIFSFEHDITLPANGTATLATLTIEGTIGQDLPCIELRADLAAAVSALDDKYERLDDLEIRADEIYVRINEVEARIVEVARELSLNCGRRLPLFPDLLPDLGDLIAVPGNLVPVGGGGGRGDGIGRLPCWDIWLNNIKFEDINIGLPVAGNDLGGGAGLVPVIPPIVIIPLPPAIVPDRTYEGSTDGATSDGAASCGSTSGSPDAIYSYSPEFDGELTLSTANSNFDTVLSVHSANPATVVNQLACNDDGPGLGIQSSLTLAVESDQIYIIRIAGFGRRAGSYRLLATFVRDQGPLDIWEGECVDLLRELSNAEALLAAKQDILNQIQSELADLQMQNDRLRTELEVARNLGDVDAVMMLEEQITVVEDQIVVKRVDADRCVNEIAELQANIASIQRTIEDCVGRIDDQPVCCDRLEAVVLASLRDQLEHLHSELVAILDLADRTRAQITDCVAVIDDLETTILESCGGPNGEAGNEVDLRYVDGLAGAGLPVRNVVTWRGDSQLPTLGTASYSLVLDTTAPAAPGGMSTEAGDGVVTLDWGGMTLPEPAGGGGDIPVILPDIPIGGFLKGVIGLGGVSSYNIYRDGELLAEGLTDSAYTDDTAENGVLYRYEITSIDSCGNESSRSSVAEASPEAPPVRGDSNGDAELNITDLIFILEYLFRGGDDLACAAAGDANGDGEINISDVSTLAMFLFLGGPDLPALDGCALGGAA